MTAWQKNSKRNQHEKIISDSDPISDVIVCIWWQKSKRHYWRRIGVKHWRIAVWTGEIGGNGVIDMAALKWSDVRKIDIIQRNRDINQWAAIKQIIIGVKMAQ